MGTGTVRVLRYLPWVLLLIVVVAGTVLLWQLSPEELVARVGSANAYALLFGLAFVSGLSLFGATPYHLVVVTLSLGGMSPWWLGLTAATGVMAGDVFSYALGYGGQELVPARVAGWAKRLAAFLHRYPRLTPGFFFLYGSVAPFSNDLVGVTMGLARFPFVRVMVPLALGNLVFNTALAFLAEHVQDRFL